MDGPDLDRLVAAHPDNAQRVFAADIGGRRVFIKQGDKNFPNRIAKTISEFGARLRGRSGITPIDQEANRIQALAALGFIVPDILRKTDTYVVLSDIGPNIEFLITSASPAERERLLREAAMTLRRLHDAGGWHGAAVLRNLTQAPTGIGFIDLENAIEVWTPLRIRQVWDLWCLGHSTALFDHTGMLTAVAIEAYGANPARTLLWGGTAVFVGSYLTLKPFQPLKKRELRQTIGCMGGIFQAGRH